MNNNQKISKKTVSGLLWTFGERISAQLVTTIVSIILARMLSPEHYGVISIVTVFISFCNVFVTCGLGTALVQKKEVDEFDYNTMFIISFSTSWILYFCLFFLAPFISEFYNIPILTSVIRIMALRLPLASINSIQQAFIQRKMLFTKFFIATLTGTVISGIVGIIMVFLNFGIWALVGQYLTNTAIGTIALFVVGDWRPKLIFSVKRAKEILPFGIRVLLSELIATAGNDLRSLVVGKSFGSSSLAYYEQGLKYPSLLVNNVNASITKVMLPTFSKYQDDIVQLKNMLRKTINLGVIILAPILVGFAVVAENFVLALLTSKWIFCVPYIRLFCISYLTRPLETICKQAILAIGKSKAIVYIMFAINFLNISTLLIATFLFNDVFMVAVGTLLGAIVSLFSYMFFSSKYFDYSLREQIEDLFKPLLLCVAMGIVVYFVGTINCNEWVLLFVQTCTGIVTYVILIKCFYPHLFSWILRLIKK